MEDINKPEVFGKVVKLPKNTNAVKFMENVKIPKNKLWYIITEKQKTVNNTELHMIKYNMEKSVNCNEFVTELKKFYLTKYNNTQLKEAFDNIRVVGNDKFSVISNIPNISVDGKKLLTKISEDLIKLLK